MADGPTVTENHEAMLTIGEEGGVESLALVASLMEQNARHSDALMASLYEGEREAHNQTKDRLDKALGDLDRIRFNVNCLLFGDPFGYDGA